MRTKYTYSEKVGIWLTSAWFERDVRHYCGTHDPVTRKEKQDKRDAEMRAEWEAKDALNKFFEDEGE